MSAIPTKRRFLFYLLLVSVVGIWGRVIVSLQQQVEVDDDVILESWNSDKMPFPSTRMVSEAKSFSTDFRDPFEPPRLLFNIQVMSAKKKQPAKKKNKTVDFPRLILHGITGATATLRDDKNEVYFVAQGEFVEGVEILKVEQDRVRVRYENQLVTLKLNP